MKRIDPSLTTNPSRQGYDRIAHIYRALESILFGNRLQQARVALLDELPSIESALFLGDGNGRLLEAFAQRFPACLITSVDQSERMLELQQKRCETCGIKREPSFVLGDALNYHPPAEQFDVLVCSFFLDCLTEAELRKTFPVWLSALKPNGLLYFVDFRIPGDGLQRIRGNAISWIMHQFFGKLTGLQNRSLPDFDSLMSDYKLEMVADGTRSRSIDPMCVCRLYRIKK